MGKIEKKSEQKRTTEKFKLEKKIQDMKAGTEIIYLFC